MTEPMVTKPATTPVTVAQAITMLQAFDPYSFLAIVILGEYVPPAFQFDGQYTVIQRSTTGPVTVSDAIVTLNALYQESLVVFVEGGNLVPPYFEAGPQYVVIYPQAWETRKESK